MQNWNKKDFYSYVARWDSCFNSEYIILTKASNLRADHELKNEFGEVRENIKLINSTSLSNIRANQDQFRFREMSSHVTRLLDIITNLFDNVLCSKVL